MENKRLNSTSAAQKIALLALVLAFRLILGMIPGFSYGPYVQIGFGFIGAMLTGAMFNPVWAVIISGAADLIEFMLAPSGVFMPGFTLSAMVGGLIYSLLFWRKDITWKRVLAAVVLVTLIVNLGMNSLWVYMMTDKAFAVFMPARILKNLVSLPLNTLIGTLIFTNPTIKRFIENYRF